MNTLRSTIGAMLAIAVIHTQALAQSLNPTNGVPNGAPPDPAPVVSAEDRSRTIIGLALEAGKGFDPQAHVAELKQTIEQLVAELRGPAGKPAKRRKPSKPKAPVESEGPVAVTSAPHKGNYIANAHRSESPAAATNPLIVVPVEVIDDEEALVNPPDPKDMPVLIAPSTPVKPSVSPDEVHAGMSAVESALATLRAQIEKLLNPPSTPAAKDAK